MLRRVFILDLDGTLFDTAPDFEATINHFRATHNLPPLALTEIMPAVNLGAVAMTRLAFSIEEDDESFSLRKQDFLDQYTSNIGKFGRLYQGMSELLSDFDNQNHPWVIATNKPRKYAEKYMAHLPFQPSLLICGDDVEKAKPDPMMLIKAAELLGIPARQMGYAGDHERDIIAAKSAGMYSIAAAYGYLTEFDKPLQWQPDSIAESPEILAQLISAFTEISMQV